MKIELLDEKTVKVLLSKVDMKSLDLCYDEMDYKNPQTKRVLLKLIDEIKKEVNINLNAGKLFIEAFPYADGGCILYVNVIDTAQSDRSSSKKGKASFDTPIIFSFDDINSLANLSGRLISRYSHIILKSSLYLWEKKYYLLLYTYFKMDNELIQLVNEYGTLFGRGSTKSAIIMEHSKEIIKSDAIRILNNTIG